MTEGGDFDKLGRGDVWRGQISTCLHQNHVFCVRPNPKRLHSDFLAALSASEYGKSYFLGCAKRSTNLASINSTQLKGFPVLLPPLSEQRRIAELLSLWDQAASVTEKLARCSEMQKNALMQQLLTGRTRLLSFHEEWETVRFSGIFERVERKNSLGNDTVLTISGRHGLISQREFFSKNIASENLDGYTLLHRGEFAYNKSHSNGYPYGAIKPLLRYPVGVVSGLYICFRLKDPKKADLDFFRHYFESGRFAREIYAIAQEGARNHGLLNVSAADFFNTKLFVPKYPEQKRIAEVIGTAERCLNNLRDQLQALRMQKNALMQQLLTGKRRLKLDAVAA